MAGTTDGNGGVIVKVEPLDKDRFTSIRIELAIYEARYGVLSENLASAFMHDGQLHETEDYRRWDFLYTVWHRVAPAFGH